MFKTFSFISTANLLDPYTSYIPPKHPAKKLDELKTLDIFRPTGFKG
jgi:hypothetical protein